MTYNEGDVIIVTASKAMGQINGPYPYENGYWVVTVAREDGTGATTALKEDEFTLLLPAAEAFDLMQTAYEIVKEHDNG